MTPILWLMKWYSEQCDGDWEHEYGVSIETLDNPGWWVKIDLAGTPLEEHAVNQHISTKGEPPSASNGNMGGPSWLRCEIINKRFDGAGDERRLEEIITVFMNWALQCIPEVDSRVQDKGSK